MDDNLQFVITSVYGRTRSLNVARRRFKSVALLLATLLIVLGVAGFTGIGFSVQNLTLHARVANLEGKLKSSQDIAREYEVRLAEQEQEKEELMQNALAELNRRSRAIESILSTVGVDIHIAESNSNTGGPYTSLMGGQYEDLTVKVDQYLEAIQFIPLGAPVPGTITSKFGKRPDPFNKRMAFHEGIDIKNHLGTKVMATADGVVVGKGRTRGFGNYVVLDHGNDFRTRFFHLQKSFVEKGEQVSRGQHIADLGSTGRSTGPHLHYEIDYQGKAIDPLKFMRIARYISLDETE